MSAPSKSLILCVHAHQPVGNFDWVFEEAYEKSYRPFFEVLEKHPAILLNCHFSGSLLDWLAAHKPEFMQMLKMLHLRGQLEFVGGGYYEPIYGMIPRKDLAGQIEMMQQKLKEFFGKTPKGAWLTERVWDPELVKPLSEAGVKFTILDDLHLENTGIEAPVTGYYETRQGKDSVYLFSSLKDLRYLMPFKPAEETVKFIRSTDKKASDCFVFGDDIEKFGFWPGTYDWVYKEGWLEQFFKQLENAPDIKLYTFSQFISAYSSKAEVKVPHASYSEMMEWSEGSFYNFFKKYPESAYMRDRMWALSDRLAKIKSKKGEKWQAVQSLLYKAQCNCSYWHGVFGGLYLHHLRSSVFENIIRAESSLAKENKRFGVAASKKIQPEPLKSGLRYRITQKNIVSFFNPAFGGALEEFDFLPRPSNLMCNLQRHEEHYHSHVLDKAAVAAGGTKEDEPLSIHAMLGAKDEDLEQHLHRDTFRRLSFMDHFTQNLIDVEDFRKSSYTDTGDFADKPYLAKKTLKGLSLSRKSTVKSSRDRVAVQIVKVASAKSDNILKVQYTLTNTSAKALETFFGVEFNFSIGDNFAMKGVTSPPTGDWVFKDSWRGIVMRLRMSQPFSLIAAPIETVSESESGLEKTYQELAVLVQKKVTLRPKASESFWMELEAGLS